MSQSGPAGISLVAVAIGGAVGALSRYGVTALMHRLVSGAWPVGTATVNVLGGLAVGFLSGWLTARQTGASHTVQVLLIVGVCGGFTTFSAFSLETVRLIHAGAWPTALVSVLGQVSGAILATGAGLWLARQLCA